MDCINDKKYKRIAKKRKFEWVIQGIRDTIELPKEKILVDDTDGKNVIGLPKKEILMNYIDSEKCNRIAKKDI